MSGVFPEAFVRRMREQLGPELSAFLHAAESEAVRGIRLNPLKPAEAAFRFIQDERIPWTSDGYYLSADSEAGATILHAAGAFYIQEPSAMLPAAVLNAQPGETILDLCAAPGGKSTQIGIAMKGDGLLVCNEPVPKRAKILSGNVERMGLPNTVVTCEWPEKLAEKWPEGFDAVLADVPCSGEGMFRREPETRLEWTPEKAAGCAERQQAILAAAARLVRPGGRLVYSTCTYNPAENEENVRRFLNAFRYFTPETFYFPGVEAPEGIFTCYPHRIKGEGQFVAAFRKAGNGPAELPEDRAFPHPLKADSDLFARAFPSLPAATHLFGSMLISIPWMPDVKGVRILRAGLHLGEIRGKAAVPDHAAALCIRTPEMQTTDLTPELARKYMAGETIPGEQEGWTLVRYQGLCLGWGKGSGGTIRNHYPKGLRSTHIQP